MTSLTSTAKTNRIALVHALSVQHVVDMWEDFAVYVHQHKADRTLCSMMREKYPGTFCGKDFKFLCEIVLQSSC